MEVIYHKHKIVENREELERNNYWSKFSEWTGINDNRLYNS